MSRIQLGDMPLKKTGNGAAGEIIERAGEKYFRIANYDRMQPFFMAVVSGYEHWMYVSSNGGLSCGRRNPSLALFPYETDDRIHDAHHTAGPMTVILVEKDAATRLWEPFSPYPRVYEIERNLYKNLAGNRLVFEEINRDLGLAFEYQWASSARFGFVRRAAVRNFGDRVQLSFMDGLRNLLPCGVDPNMQATRSTLLDAYRQAELEDKTGAGIYTLSSIPTDRAEPSEALRATCAWNQGLQAPEVFLSVDAVQAFRNGDAPANEGRVLGRRADYFVHAQTVLEPGEKIEWRLIADVGLGPSNVVALLRDIADGVSDEEIERDIDAGARRLEQRAASADAFQASADIQAATRHYANALFNIMRGGVFHEDYSVPRADFLDFVKTWNAPLAQRAEDLLSTIDQPVSREVLVETARNSGDADLERLALEYLPLTFSRRHGDPSRPWNAFDIDIMNPDGSEKLSYEGNWRDIFQNWEALAYSFPGFLENFIAKFVNASTVDGYNPYRITRAGVDWELLDPEDPWSYIGYWGDHQVNYLLRLLELEQACFPGRLAAYLDREIFVYADVPYRIRNYEDMLADPRDTVTFDDIRQAEVEDRVLRIGSDGRLCVLPDGSPARATLLEKLLLVALSKLANVVPGGGVWMNTQRPEWNDANNALVGYGLSMVTLCYLRRYLRHLDSLIDENGSTPLSLSVEMLDFFAGVLTVLNETDSAAAVRDDRRRKRFMDGMGAVFDAYRRRVYGGLSGQRGRLESERVKALLTVAVALLDECIAVNARPDGLYQSYNILSLEPVEHGVENLPVMLEGQVAVLASGVLDPEQSLALLDALRRSPLYRADQGGYTLYPNRELPAFLQKNIVPIELAGQNAWLLEELESGRSDIVERDIEGQVHFNGRFRNAAELRQALDSERGLGAAEADAVCALFENVFDHRRFTGRSGSMYKYEGLGCIYWHMVSKLLLAVADTMAVLPPDSGALRERLLGHFDAIKAGIGAHKSPAEYGAFPTDPYSHTPAFTGVQQPGMTGQVKEDLISRCAELGIKIRDGRVRFRPDYLKRSEFLAEARRWALPAGEQTLDLPADSLAFTMCGVPVIYRAGNKERLRLYRGRDEALEFQAPELDTEWTRALFARDGSIRRIEVEVDTRRLR